MQIVNLTPHEVTLVRPEGTSTIPPSGMVARVAGTATITGWVEVGNLMVPITTQPFGEVTGLPGPQDGTAYIVSAMVADAVAGRADVLYPADQVRDDANRIVGCRGLGVMAPQAHPAAEGASAPATLRDRLRIVIHGAEAAARAAVCASAALIAIWVVAWLASL